MRKPKSKKPRVGRPELPVTEKTRPRSVRLNDARWAKFQRLGREWLEKVVDEAPEPGATKKKGRNVE
jgi:hypothetical protein